MKIFGQAATRDVFKTTLPNSIMQDDPGDSEPFRDSDETAKPFLVHDAEKQFSPSFASLHEPAARLHRERWHESAPTRISRQEDRASCDQQCCCTGSVRFHSQESHSEEVLVVAVPVALEEFVGIVALLQAQELTELCIARFHLLARGVLVISQIITPSTADRHVDETTKRRRRMLLSFGGVDDMEVEDDTGIGLCRPGQKTFLVALDQPNRAVDDVHLILAEIIACFVHEINERASRDVDF